MVVPLGDGHDLELLLKSFWVLRSTRGEVDRWR